MTTKPRIKDLKCFPEVASILGESQAQLELFKVVHTHECNFDNLDSIIYAFDWYNSPQGLEFWDTVWLQGLTNE